MTKKSVLILVLLLNFSFPLLAQGDLMVFPKRIVFDGIKNVVQNVNLSNTGKDTITYRLSYNQIQMDKDGRFNTIEHPEENQNFASPYLRYYPHTVTLAPNESQIVKIQLIKTSELKEGEYRSHLYFRAVPKTKLLEIETPATDTLKPKGLDIQLTPIYGISIANIITIGTSNTVVTLSNLALLTPQELTLDINRTGNQSAYGELNVNYISPEGISTNVGLIKGYAIYAPGNLRKTKIKLNTIPSIDFSKGKLQVTYFTLNQEAVYAESFLDLSA
ncbi:molecular chaperone [Flavobacterium algoritolerans]|uniref:Molecular chaperone n=1 Tax=Flavobacterium algoritolerans TaxID=3041254 RepID=A0ABT6VBY9_9FLAO|nr:molecular chaperone [Flavobacterium algoritolerans]MDI5895768.1 molecular chaperone [Flavobacterium algoritolerans]